MIDLTVVEDAEAAARACADQLATTIAVALSRRNVAHVVLAGGRTPARTYELLAELVDDWRDVHLWFGDERCVPLDAPDSNDTLVRNSLLERLPAGAAPPVVHAVAGAGGGDPAAAAAAYERELRATVPDATGARAGLPLLDAALLGLGEDGHTASLFPDDPVLEEQERLCVAVHGRKPPFERVTLTLPLLRNVRQPLVLAAGAGKAQAVAAMLAGPSPHIPASLLGEGASVELVVDRAAAPA